VLAEEAARLERGSIGCGSVACGVSRWMLVDGGVGAVIVLVGDIGVV
jgi:hypothetical protein